MTVLKRVQFTTSRPIFGHHTRHTFLANALYYAHDGRLAIDLGPEMLFIDAEIVTGLRVGPEPHPDNWGCKCCPIDMPCRHLKATREANSYDGGVE